MSKEVDRRQVFRTTKVRTVLRNDSSWIQKPRNDDEEEENEVRIISSPDGPLAVRQEKSYVLETARKFGSIDASVLPHPDAAEVSPVKRPQPSPMKESHNGESKLESSVEERIEENVESSEDAANITVVSPEKECAQALSVIAEETEALSSVEPAGQPLTNQTAVNSVESVEQSADPSTLDSSAPEVSAEVAPLSPGVNGSCGKELLEKVEDVAEADVIEETQFEAPCVVHESEKEEGEISVEPVPDIVESVTKAPSHPADKIPSDVCEASSAEPCTDEKVETAIDLMQESTPAVDSVTQQLHDAPHNTMENVPDVVLEICGSDGEISVPPHLVCEVDPTLQNEPKTKTQEEAEIVIELSAPEEEQRVTKITIEENVGGEIKSSTSEEDSVKTPAEGNTENLIAWKEHRFSDEVVVLNGEPKSSSHEEPSKDEGSKHEVQVELQDPAILNTITVAELEVEAAPQEEHVLKATHEEADVCEEQSDDRIPEEQKAEPALTIPEEHVTELNGGSSSEPAAVPDAGTVPNDEVNTLIKLTDALDDEPPPVRAVPLPERDPDPPQTEEPKQNIQYINKRVLKGLCSFCNQIIDGHVKITLNDPPVTCHPNCLKCGVCDRVLGDFLHPMFLHGQVIQCGSCFATTLGI